MCTYFHIYYSCNINDQNCKKKITNPCYSPDFEKAFDSLRAPGKSIYKVIQSNLQPPHPLPSFLDLGKYTINASY